MRISTSTIYDSSVANMQQQTAKLMQIQEQIGASRRIMTPADDPSASARVLEISQSQGINQQYDANIGAAKDSLGLEESVIASITDLLQNAKDATNAAGNGSYSQADRITLAGQLRSQYQELIGLANSTDTSGQFMFAGYRSASSPFSQASPGVVTYNGDQGQRLLQVGPTRQIEVSDSGGGLFVNIPDGNGSFVTRTGNTISHSTAGAVPTVGDIAANTFAINGVNVGAVAGPALRSVAAQGALVAAAINLVSGLSGVSATALATGAVTLTAAGGRPIAITGTLTDTGLSAGVTPASTNAGTGLIDNGNVLDAMKWNSVANAPFSIKFAGAATVVAAPTNVGDASGTVGIVDQKQWNAGSKNYSIEFTSATDYDIVDNATGSHVVIGTNNYTTGAPIKFQGFEAVINDGLVPLQAGDTFAINPGAASALTYDIVDSGGTSLLTGGVAGSPPYARSFSPGASIGLKSQGAEPAFDYGVETKISGTPAAGDTFSITPSTTQDVFKTMSDLASLLESGAGATARTNELGRLQRDLDNALNNFISARASVGSRLKELDGLKNGNDSLALQYSQSLSRLQDLDYAKAASEFTQQQVTLQASQQTFVKVAGLSLFNYL